MVFAPHHRLTFAGLFGTTAAPVERFQFTLNYAGTGDPTQAQADALVTPFQNLLTAICPTWVGADYCKVATVGADGKYTANAKVAYAPAKTTFGTLMYPPQVAFVVSLGTGVRGPSNRGRFYLPGPNAAINTNTGLLDSATVDTYAGNVKTFVNAVTTAVSGGTGGDWGSHPVIASTRGTLTEVTSIRVGRALDTMRSRRRALKETYSGPLAL